MQESAKLRYGRRMLRIIRQVAVLGGIVVVIVEFDSLPRLIPLGVPPPLGAYRTSLGRSARELHVSGLFPWLIGIVEQGGHTVTGEVRGRRQATEFGECWVDVHELDQPATALPWQWNAILMMVSPYMQLLLIPEKATTRC